MRIVIAALLAVVLSGLASAADWNAPALSDTYVNFANQLKNRDIDAARMFDPAYTSPTNLPTQTIRWNSSTNRLERWNGSSWGELVLSLSGGGCGASSAAACRTALGLAIGSDVQAYDSDLAAVANLATNGLIARTATGSVAARTLACGTGLTCTNGNGVSGNPTVTPSANLQAWSGKAVPAGAIADLSTAQTLTNKSLPAPVITGGSINNTPIGASTRNTGAFTAISATGNMTHTKSCGAGPGSVAWTRAGPGVCVPTLQYAHVVTAPRDGCTQISLPAGAAAMMIQVYVAARAANAAGQRSTTVSTWSNSACSAGNATFHRVVGYEFSAVPAESVLNSSHGIAIITSSNQWIKMEDDAGNTGLGQYWPLIAWDN